MRKIGGSLVGHVPVTGGSGLQTLSHVTLGHLKDAVAAFVDLSPHGRETSAARRRAGVAEIVDWSRV